MELSIRELRLRHLFPGREFTGEFIGKMNSSLGANNLIARRRVRKQGTKEMVCIFLEGPKEGQEIALPWAGAKARLENEQTIIITNTVNNEDFLKITLHPVTE